jgi:hypothetical protein
MDNFKSLSKYMLILLWIFPFNVFSQISEAYPLDVGIENDPLVWFAEKFDDGLDNILARYSTVANSEGMSLENDRPVGLSGKSLKITGKQGLNSGGYLYKNFPEGFGNEVYIRYYVKYPAISKNYFHHEGIWIGGYHPPLDWPYPRAGICGLGDTRFSIAYEVMDSNWLHPYTHIAPYIYWGEMRSFPDGACWGNFMQCGDHNPPPETLLDEWTCVEIMVKLNDPPSENNGELKTWINGVETGHWGRGFPNGSWVWGNFFLDPQEQDTFEGFKWREYADQLVNYIWIQFYHDHPDAPSSYAMYDNVVVAKKYIGPVYSPPSGILSSELHSIKLFPNPAYGQTHLAGLESGTDFSISDIYNRIVYQGKTDQDPDKINISLLKPGIYFFNSHLKGLPVWQKLVVQSYGY